MDARIIAGLERRGFCEGDLADCTTLHHFGVPRSREVYRIRGRRDAGNFDLQEGQLRRARALLGAASDLSGERVVWLWLGAALGRAKGVRQ